MNHQTESRDGASPATVPPRDHSACAGHGPGLAHVRLTPSRQRILDILCETARPIGAYDLIERVGERTGKRPAPISVYRVLDFLVEHGLAHRLSSCNAFLACARHHAADAPHAFLICEGCGGVSEEHSPALTAALDAVAQRVSFNRRTQIVEMTGLCATCQSADHA